MSVLLRWGMCLLLVVFAVAVRADTATFIGPAGGDYRTAANWTPAVVPDNNLGGSFDVLINANAPLITGAPLSLSNLKITAPGTRLLDSTLTVSGNSDVLDFTVSAALADAIARFGALGGAGATSPAFGESTAPRTSLRLEAALGRTATAEWAGANIVNNFSVLTFSGQGTTRIQTPGGANGLANFAGNFVGITGFSRDPRKVGSLAVLDGQNFAVGGDFTNDGTVRVIASPGTANTSFTIPGVLTNISAASLTAPTYTGAGSVPAIYEVRAAPGLTATLRVGGANIVRIGQPSPGPGVFTSVNVVLDGPGAGFVDEFGNNALRNLQVIDGNFLSASLEIANGYNFATAGDFLNAGRLIVAAASGTNTTFNISGHFRNFDVETSAEFIVDAQPGGNATLRGSDLNIASLGNRWRLSGPGSAILDGSGLDGLRQLVESETLFQLAEGRTFTSSGDFSNTGEIIVGSSTPGANSRFTVTGALQEFAGGTLGGEKYTAMAHNGGTAVIELKGVAVTTSNASLFLSGADARIVDENGINAIANLAAITGDLTFAGGHNFTTAGSLSSTRSLTVNSGSSVVSVRSQSSTFAGVATTLTVTQDLINQQHLAIVSPTGAPASIVVNGNLTRTPIAGSVPPSTGMSVLENGGSASLIVKGTLSDYDSATRTLTRGIYSLRNLSQTGALRIEFPGADIVTNNAAIIYETPTHRSLNDVFVDSTGNDGLRNLATNGAAGTIELRGAAMTTGGSFNNLGKLSVDNAGSLLVPVGSDFTNAGTARVERGGSVIADIYRQAGGKTTVLDGVITARSLYEQTGGETVLALGDGRIEFGELRASELRFLGGELRGIGNIRGNVFSNATLDPSFAFELFDDSNDDGEFDGLSFITVTGTLTFGNNSLLGMDVSGEFDFEQIEVSDLVTLDGNLRLGLAFGFIPSPADTFDILLAPGGITGAFDNVPSGGRLFVEDGSGSFQVDYGGPDFPNSVVLSDFQVPEPSALVLLALAACAIGRRKRA